MDPSYDRGSLLDAHETYATRVIDEAREISNTIVHKNFIVTRAMFKEIID